MQRFNKLNYLQSLRGANLTHAQYRVLVTILTYANPDGTHAHPGYAKLSRECRMSKGTVSKCIAQLKKSGWLWEVSRGYPSEHGNVSSVYDLRTPEYVAQGGFPESTTRSAQYKSGLKQPREDPWG